MRNQEVMSSQDDASSELDVRALGSALKRRSGLILVSTALAFVLASVFVNVVTPRYTGESQVLLENQETFFTRPDRTNGGEQVVQVDPEAVGSQIQLITSRDLASRAIRALDLAGDTEFDPAARGISALNRVLVLLGVVRDPTRDSAESRILQTFQEKLSVFSPPKTRVITIQFQSRDPDRAARGANIVAELYIAEQSSAKRAGAKGAAEALSGQIVDLRVKLAKADAEREQYRAASGLLAGSNNMTISGQQLADINSDLSKARSLQADSQAKASMIRELLRSGKAANVPDVVNSDLVRRVSDQRVAVQSQLALESNTLLAGHPRIKDLTAQLAGLDLALKAAAKQAISTLENEAAISGQRVVNLEAVLARQSKVAGAANEDEVRLRSLDRIAQSFKDQLDSSTTKYQEAIARETSNATPADARIIGRATRPQEPTFPKKLPIIAFATIATLVFVGILVIANELLSGAARPVREGKNVSPAPIRRSAADETVPVTAGAVEMSAAPARSPRAVGQTEASRPRRHFVFDTTDSIKPRALQLLPAWLDGTILPRSVIPWLKTFGRSAAASRISAQGSVMASSDAARRDPAGDAAISRSIEPRNRYEALASVPDDQPHDHPNEHGADIESLAARIVAAHLPGRGLHVVGASMGAATAGDDLIMLAQLLSNRGRSIIVDLNATPSMLARLAGLNADGGGTIDGLVGLSELLSGDASFAEVIHRDHASRLHFIPTGGREADFRDFDLILDALSETYDFITLLAPAFPRSEIAKVMAPYADFVVLAAAAGVEPRKLVSLEGELIEAGAREVIVLGRPVKPFDLREPNVA